MHRPLISVIVPVYNVAAYLRRCVESLLAQTYPCIEVILVNDGSTDDSLVICREYERLCPNIKVIDKPNGGQSSARNAGLKITEGEYIGFVDSDDWVTPDMYDTLYGLIKEYDADAAQIAAVMAYGSDMQVIHGEEKEFVLTSRNEILERFMYDSVRVGLFGIWNCLFRADIVKNISFREGKVFEDVEYKYRALAACRRFVTSDKVCYFYFQHDSSTINTKLRRKDLDLYDAAEELYQLTQSESYGHISAYGRVKKARTAFTLLCRIAYYGVSDEFDDPRALIKRLTAEHRANLGTLLKAPLPLNRKLLALLLAANINLVRLPLRAVRFNRRINR